MHIYGAWARPNHFEVAMSTTNSTDTSYRRTAYSRCAIQVVGNAGYICSYSLGNLTSAWLSAWGVYGGNIGASNRMLGVRSGLGNTPSLYVSTNSSGYITLNTCSAADAVTVLATSATVSVSYGQLHKIDIQIIDYGSTATVNVYINSVLAITYSGDVTVDGATSFDRVAATSRQTGLSIRLSEIILSDSDTRNMILRSRYITGAGDTNEMEGTYADVDEITTSDADAVYTDVAGEKANFAIAANPAGSFAVDARVIHSRACKTGDAAIGSMKHGFKINGAEVMSDAIALDTAWANYMYVLQSSELAMDASDTVLAAIESAA